MSLQEKILNLFPKYRDMKLELSNLYVERFKYKHLVEKDKYILKDANKLNPELEKELLDKLKDADKENKS